MVYLYGFNLRQYDLKGNRNRLRHLGETIIKDIVKNKFSLESITILRNQYGKPYILELPGFYYNISHQGDWLICGISNQQIGVDVIFYAGIKEKIIDRFYSNVEKTIISQCASFNSKVQVFHDLWGVKESHSKAGGEGVNEIDKLLIFNKENLERLQDSFVYKNGFYLKKFPICSQYAVIVCSKSKYFFKNIFY